MLALLPSCRARDEMVCQCMHATRILDERSQVHENRVLVGLTTRVWMTRLVATTSNQLEASRQLTPHCLGMLPRKGLL